VLNDYDEFSFIVDATNTGAVTVKVDGMGAAPIATVSSGSQILKGALLTVRFIGEAFYIANQINPYNGNNVADVLKLIVDTTDVLYPGEYALNGSEINSVYHPIACAKAAASSNYIAQATKDADPIPYCGYFGFFEEIDGSTTVTLPIVGGEFIRMFDESGAKSLQEFAEWWADEFKSHNHTQTRRQATDAGGGSYGRAHASLETVSTGSSGGNETRPRSIAYYGKTRL
jgi:hypothetical protein